MLYGFHANKLLLPGVDGRAYSWRQSKKLVFWPAMLKDMERVRRTVQLMDMVAFTFSHVEGFESFEPRGLGIYVIGGNTRGGRKREGAYYPIFRSWRMIPAIYNHIGPYVQAHQEELSKRMAF